MKEIYKEEFSKFFANFEAEIGKFLCSSDLSASPPIFEIFQQNCCREKKSREILNFLKIEFYPLELCDTLEDKIKILSIRKKSDLDRFLKSTNQKLKIGDKFRLYAAIKKFHRSKFWPNNLQNNFGILSDDENDGNCFHYSNFNQKEFVNLKNFDSVEEANFYHQEGIFEKAVEVDGLTIEAVSKKKFYFNLMNLSSKLALIKTQMVHLSSFYKPWHSENFKNYSAAEYLAAKKSIKKICKSLKETNQNLTHLIAYADKFYDLSSDQLKSQIDPDIFEVDEKYGLGFKIFGMGLLTGLSAGCLYHQKS